MLQEFTDLWPLWIRNIAFADQSDICRTAEILFNGDDGIWRWPVLLL